MYIYLVWLYGLTSPTKLGAYRFFVGRKHANQFGLGQRNSEQDKVSRIERTVEPLPNEEKNI